jgi:hypothetical protein
MSLVSHRLFMPKLLMSENREVSDTASFAISTYRFAGLVRLLQIVAVTLQIPLPVP